MWEKPLVKSLLNGLASMSGQVSRVVYLVSVLVPPLYVVDFLSLLSPLFSVPPHVKGRHGPNHLSSFFRVPLIPRFRFAFQGLHDRKQHTELVIFGKDLYYLKHLQTFLDKKSEHIQVYINNKKKAKNLYR